MVISNADSKDDIQGAMTSDEAIKNGQKYYQECFNVTIEQTNWLISYYNDVIHKFGNIFRDAYDIEPLEYQHGVGANSISKKNYKNSFSTASLSTFLLKRMFIKKETIRNEMREAVRNYLISKFEDLYNYYFSKIKKIDEKLSKSVDKTIQQYNKKYSKVITSQIEKELGIEKLISDEIDGVSKQILALENLMR